MTCEEFRALWEARMDEDSPEIDREMNEHLETCPVCLKRLEDQANNDPVAKLLRALAPRLFHKPNDPSTS